MRSFFQNKEYPNALKRFLLILSLTLSLLLCACSEEVPTLDTQASPHAEPEPPMVSATETTAAVDGIPAYPYTFSLENGEEMTITLYGNDPAAFAELHLAQLDNTEVFNRVVLHREASGTGVSIEHAHVFDGTTGDALPVTPVADCIAQYVTVANTEDAWILTVAGTDYRIEKAQFADYPTEELLEIPDFSLHHDFSIENGQLFCTVRMLCAGPDTGFAAESLRIRYGFGDAMIVPAEITFLKTETTPNSPVTEEAETATEP